jgi:CheY-like chemotaxis protein
VVVVDDEPSQLSIARRWLEREGYEVQLVGKPLATFDVVLESQPRFVLIDLVMPEQNGLSILAQLKRDERTSHIPVIASSAFHQNQQKVVAAGGIWLPKPWNLQRLAATHLEDLIRELGAVELEAGAPRVRRLSSLVSRILYVEDEDANWEVTQLSLRGKYELVRAKSSEEAFQLLRSSSFDLMLLDIQLKGSRLNGIETCEVLTGRRGDDVPEFARGVRFSGPIVFVTAYAALHDREELKQSGARELISKPVDFTHLLMVLSRIALQGAVSEIHAA